MKVWPYEVSYIHAILQLYIQFCLDLQINIFFLLSSDNSFWFTFKDVVILVSLLLHWHVKILIDHNLIYQGSAAAHQPRISLKLNLFQFCLKRDCNIWVSFQLIFKILISLRLTGGWRAAAEPYNILAVILYN